ncbi:unnamed protein product [Callosobruchus maculatus]|uniref:Uncharacterized protein n=1 Tax=Callosobruchus maculatus TaxID=64391 RepID=A0A653D289_CALMS|nr:unnamed protein product [Callosobruchus maculatus]
MNSYFQKFAPFISAPVIQWNTYHSELSARFTFLYQTSRIQHAVPVSRLPTY